MAQSLSRCITSSKNHLVRAASVSTTSSQWFRAARSTNASLPSAAISGRENSFSDITTTTTVMARFFSSQQQKKQQEQQKHAQKMRENFKPEPPEKIDFEMAEGIQESVLFYIRCGIPFQRLQKLGELGDDFDLVLKWTQMMEIFLSSQVMVISGLGYPPDEKGLQQYTADLASFMQKCGEEDRKYLKKVGDETWREMLTLTFDLDPSELKSVPIVDARNIMHKVSSKMIEPDVLMELQKQCARLPTISDTTTEEQQQVIMAQKHTLLQQTVVDRVYMGGSPNLPEETGFGSGSKGYARMQLAMSEHEGDPMIAQYMTSAMIKLWKAAGMDLSNFHENKGNLLPMGNPSPTK